MEVSKTFVAVALIATGAVVSVAGYNYHQNQLSDQVKKCLLVAYDAPTKSKMDEYLTMARMVSKTKKDEATIHLAQGLLDEMHEGDSIVDRASYNCGEANLESAKTGVVSYSVAKTRMNTCFQQSKVDLNDLGQKMVTTEHQLRPILGLPYGVKWAEGTISK